jgi:UDP-glucose 4-epimerase
VDLKDKKFVVIGGAGLIGSHTVEALLREEVREIIIYDNFARGSLRNLSNSLQDSRVKIFEGGGDILQVDVLQDALKEADGVFHFAAMWLLQCHQYPKTAFDVNIMGTHNVIEACVKCDVKKLIYSSSASVYGDAIYSPMDEAHPFNNENFYGATKIAGEAMLRAYHFRYGLPFLGLRYMNVYGPRQDYKGAYIAVMMKMLDAIDANDSPIIFGDGSEAFDFVAVEDCARANVLAMKSEHSNDFFNVCTGVQTSLNELATKIIELTGCKKKIKYQKSSNATLVKNRIGSPEKAIKFINFESEISLDNGLKNLIQWRIQDKLNNDKA